MATIEERFTASGQKRYRARVRRRGHPALSKEFDRKADAVDWAKAREVEIRFGQLNMPPSRSYKVGDLIDKYVDEVLPTKKDSRNQERQLRWWKARLGQLPLTDLTPAVLSTCKTELLTENIGKQRRRSPATVNRYLAAFSPVLSKAAGEWQFLADNPMRRIGKLKEPSGRCRYLSDKEREALLKACEASRCKALYPAVVLALSTGMRKGEILSLTWGQIDFERGHITLEHTKNGDRRGVPLVDHARDVLLARRPKDFKSKTLVFASRTGRAPQDLTKAWQTAVKRANLADFRYHDLRHSAASYLAMNGASSLEIAALLGHKQLQMVKRYTHLSTAHLESRVSEMNQKIFAQQARTGTTPKEEALHA